MHLSIFHAKNCNIDPCACLCDSNFEKTVKTAGVTELPSSTEESCQYQVLWSIK